MKSDNHCNNAWIVFIVFITVFTMYAIGTEQEIKELNAEIVACEREIAKLEIDKIIATEREKASNYKSANIDEATEIRPPYIIDITDKEVEVLYYVVANEVGSDYLTDESRKLVTSVVINRVNSNDFPNTVLEVVSAPNQFTEAYRNYYAHNVEPSPEVKACVNEVLINGTVTTATYYYAPKYTSWYYSNWFETELEFVEECDGQRFFKDYERTEDKMD